MSSLPLAQLGRLPRFSREGRFAAMFGAPPPKSAEPGAMVDPLVHAYERGYREGATKAAEEARVAEHERDAARAEIELVFAQLDAEDAERLRDRLKQTVLALCEAAVLPLALDADGLLARIERAVTMLQRAQDERLVRVHPDDLALIEARLPGTLKVKADPSVERGGLRIETPDGGIEDGPTHWRRALAEAFRQC